MTRELLGVFSSKTSLRQLAPALVLLLNTFTWYTFTHQIFTLVVDNLSVSSFERLLIFVMYFSATAFSALLGAKFLRHTDENYLVLWMLAGTLMTTFLITVPENTTLSNSLIGLFFGISVGIGFSACLAYFGDLTTVENRGTSAGIVWATVSAGTVALTLLTNDLDISQTLVALAAWRALGVIAFFIMKGRTRKTEQLRSPVAFSSILSRRDMLLYLIPWLLVSLVNFVESPMLETLFGDFYITAEFIEFALAAVLALLAGIMADRVGRKRIIIAGFMMLGIGYAVLSFFSGLTFSLYLFTACDGIAWGMFTSVFFITLWGDLAHEYEKDKYYVLGGLPFLVAGFSTILVKPYVQFMSTIVSFSLASFFLFFAVLPLLSAPETLPEKEIRSKELRSYAEMAKKARDKKS